MRRSQVRSQCLSNFFVFFHDLSLIRIVRLIKLPLSCWFIRTDVLAKFKISFSKLVTNILGMLTAEILIGSYVLGFLSRWIHGLEFFITKVKVGFLQILPSFQQEFLSFSFSTDIERDEVLLVGCLVYLFVKSIHDVVASHFLLHCWGFEGVDGLRIGFSKLSVVCCCLVVVLFET